MKIIGYFGTFNPFTKHDHDMVRRAASLFDEVLIFVKDHNESWFEKRSGNIVSMTNKIDMISDVTAYLKTVKVVVADHQNIITHSREHKLSAILSSTNNDTFNNMLMHSLISHSNYNRLELIQLMPSIGHDSLTEKNVQELFKENYNLAWALDPQVLQYYNRVVANARY